MPELTANQLEAIDTQIATLVMGWHREEQREYMMLNGGVFLNKGPCWVDETGNTQAAVAHWSPTQHIAQAMEVFATCPDMVLGHGSEGEGYQAVVPIMRRDGTANYIVPAVTLPLAICVAALRRAGITL